MLLKNFIKIKNVNSPNDLIVRKTKYILRIIWWCFLISIVLILILIIATLEIRGEQKVNDFFLIFLDNAFGTLVLVFMVFLWIILMRSLISYFYYVVIISHERVVKISFDLFFREEVKILELYRVLSITSSQNGMLKSVFDYGDIIMKVQNAGNMLITKMPNPKKIIQKIEQLKEHTTKERIS